MHVNMIDNGPSGIQDSISFVVVMGNADPTVLANIIYSSNWITNQTLPMNLTSGNLVVHSGFNVGTVATKTPTIITGINDNPAKLLTAPDKRFTMGVKVFEVKAWPNPSTQYFNLNVESSNTNEQVVVKVFDISGKLVHVVKGAVNNNFRFGENFISGVYIVEVSQGGERRQLKMLKQVD
jgi:hypothetical protein